ncbi:MAG: CarD family transcriptional regulator [Oscillospiraceae bacterium]|jgi:CarD family transcriptional regulator|nr:CarD family transcriptional regulator [Oscillospiraceae bacterium]MCI9586516.1 CarD family transcriptional regulator [Oscillospiraceae bacterium]
MFNVGDKVVHPMHGAGVIDSIVSERINGKTQEYYVFHMPVNGLVLKIPVCNSQLVGLRSVVDAAAADTVMLALPGLEIDITTNWNRRYRENLERLKSGDLYEVGRVIKCLTLRDVERGLSTGERKMLHSAKQIFISEMVLATDEPYQEIESRVNASMV